MLACLFPAAALVLISEPRRWSQSKVAGELTSQRADQPAVNLAGNRQTLIRLEKPNCAAGLRPMTPSNVLSRLRGIDIRFSSGITRHMQSRIPRKTK